jgi:ribonuclease HII
MTKEDRINKQIERLKEMQRYENALHAAGRSFIAGVDEVGRGPLAGPVVAAAVILPADFSLLGVDDSKKLSAGRRDRLFEEIKAASICWAIGWRDNACIDKINILEATREAMREAIGKLSVRPDHVLIDALTLKNLNIPQTGILRGDSTSVSIAAASILAKVTRDREMEEYHKHYPWYAFDSNKGYGTKMHYEGLDSHGPCPLHRKSFLTGYFEKGSAWK